MKVYKVLEQESKFLGLRKNELIAVLLVFISFAIVLGAVGIFVRVSRWLYLLAFVLTATLYGILYYLNKKGSGPTFLFSFIAYHFLKPRNVKIHDRYYRKRRDHDH